MAITEAITSRLAELIATGPSLAQGYGEERNCQDEKHIADCVGWLTAAARLVCQVCVADNDWYRLQAIMIAGTQTGWVSNNSVAKLLAILQQLTRDIEAGLVSSIANSVRGETFDDFLDHAEEYARENRHQEAGVIAGVVFEDTLRRICRSRGIEERGVNLDRLVDELGKVGLIQSVKVKRAKGAAGVRTKATHAQWDEFDLNDVKSAIILTRELIDQQLAG